MGKGGKRVEMGGKVWKRVEKGRKGWKRVRLGFNSFWRQLIEIRKKELYARRHSVAAKVLFWVDPG